MMSDLDGHNSDQASQYRGLGLRESDFEQHHNDYNHLQYYGRKESEVQWPQAAIEEEDKQR